MERINSLEELQFDDKVSVNEQGKPILGRLYGPVADIVNSTRNGRKYSEELWENVFTSDISKETFDAGGYFGELGHPADREEVDMEKIALCMPKPPVKDKDGHLVAYFDILDTPNGRILKTLCDYGYKMGISSRGSGDVSTDNDGNESVSPDTYSFTCFDAVLLPSVKAARMNYVTESLHSKSLTEALQEVISKSTADEKKVIAESLNDLGIAESLGNQPSLKVVNDIDTPVVPNSKKADDVGMGKLVEELQRTLESKLELESQISKLQEKLSVCTAKDNALKEELSTAKKNIGILSQKVKELPELRRKVQFLEDAVADSRKDIKLKNKTIKELNESLVLGKRNLTETVDSKNERITTLSKENRSLKESLISLREEHNDLKDKTSTEIEELKKDSAIKNKEYQTKLSRANALIESYKKIATDTLNSYIDSQAHLLGVSPKEIKSRLEESYSLADVNRVCDNLKEYKLNLSSLPFEIGNNTRVKAVIHEDKQFASPWDDDIDENLLKFMK